MVARTKPWIKLAEYKPEEAQPDPDKPLPSISEKIKVEEERRHGNYRIETVPRYPGREHE